jgi:hypothetical protein
MDADPNVELRERLTHALVFAESTVRALRDALALLDEKRRLDQLAEGDVRAMAKRPHQT